MVPSSSQRARRKRQCSQYRGVRNNSICKKITWTKPLQPTHQSKAEAKTSLQSRVESLYCNGIPSSKLQPVWRKEGFSCWGFSQSFLPSTKRNQFFHIFVDKNFKIDFQNSFFIHSANRFFLNKNQQTRKMKKLKR